MPSVSYRKGRREEESLVRLLRSLGLYAYRQNLSGRGLPLAADLLVRVDGGYINTSVKFGKNVPQVLWRAAEVIFPSGVRAIELGLSHPSVRVARDLRFVAKELAVADVLFARGHRKPWKLVFQEGESSKLAPLIQAWLRGVL